MKHLLFAVICTFFFARGLAQKPHTPDPAAKKMNDRAVDTYIKSGKNKDSIASALNLLTNALTIDSIYYNAWANKISFECQLGQYDNALKTTKRMINFFPDEIDMIFFSGILSFKTGHDDDAKEIFNKLVKWYDKIQDTNDNTDHLKTTMINKALALKLLGQDDESKRILVNMSVSEPDLAVRRHINSYIAKTKDDIINDMIAAR